MTKPMIEVHNIGKRYRLGEAQSDDLLRDRIANGIAAMFGRANRQRAPISEFWALKGVSFNVSEGEVVGVIGRNGAGKSTLLKILSRITEPTHGEIYLRGRVASLLEVGTGFQKELTGRENVFLNGSILGMSRAEIRKKFNDIVEFSGVEQFIDTPVKRYSSGMTVRLAFAVAAHLEPEILMIDEVLAVGDAEFQKRCLGKMGEVAKGGRTILFVSHNLAAVEGLCDRVAYLKSGKLVGIGPTSEVIAQYIAEIEDASLGEADLVSHAGRPKTARPLMSKAWVSNESGSATGIFDINETMTIGVSFDSPGRPFSPVLGYVIKDQLGTPIFSLDNRIVAGYELADSVGGDVFCEIPKLPLMPGHYSIDLYLGDRARSIDTVLDAVSFTVIESDVYGSGRLPHAHTGRLVWNGRWWASPGGAASRASASSYD